MSFPSPRRETFRLLGNLERQERNQRRVQREGRTVIVPLSRKALNIVVERPPRGQWGR